MADALNPLTGALPAKALRDAISDITRELRRCREEEADLIYDAYTHPMLFRYYSDNAEVPPGVNRFDLHPFQFQGGKPAQYRSAKPLPTGSRFGPQNMVVCGWALQALKAYPGLWEERYTKQFGSDLRVGFVPRPCSMGGLDDVVM